MKVKNKPEQKNITESKLDNKVPTNCPLKEHKKHEFEDIIGDIYSKNNNALNETQSLTTVSKLPRDIHAYYILEDDVKSDN